MARCENTAYGATLILPACPLQKACVLQHTIVSAKQDVLSDRLALVAVLVLVVVGLAEIVSALVAMPAGKGVADDALAYRLVVVIVLS